ncbi:MAG TPA: sigma-70 family RNA polymerase sigma factor [Miltoncostaeaceae bacterium]|nr:sigma-70 family RNA polymerase sigma factor [Miltoncostaeaceae bacterium]
MQGGGRPPKGEGGELASVRHRRRRLARDGRPGGGADAEDARLLARVADGDDGEALVDLYRRYETPLYRLGLRLLKDEGMAEELVQDTFVRLWRTAARFDPARGSARTYLFVIAYGAVGDLRRRSASRPLDVTPDDQVEARAPAAADGIDQILLGMAVGDALDTLSPDHNAVLRMYFEEDLSQPQIADRLGIPLGTVKTRTHHALRALRRELEERAVI